MVHGPLMRSDCHYSTFRVDVTEWGADPCRSPLGHPPAHHGVGVGRGSFPGPGSSSSPRQRPGLSRFSCGHLTVLPAASKDKAVMVKGGGRDTHVPPPHFLPRGEVSPLGQDTRDPWSVRCLGEFQRFLPRMLARGDVRKRGLVSWSGVARCEPVDDTVTEQRTRPGRHGLEVDRDAQVARAWRFLTGTLAVTAGA